MPTRSSANAGAVTFNSPATTDWQAVGGDLSGKWSNPANWSTGVVPGIDDSVVISDNAAATSPWTVTETNESAGSLTLAMHLGTLEAVGGLTVANTLTQTLGTLFAENLAGITVGALTQTGGTIVLDDNGDSFTPFSSVGTDTVDGVVTLVNGANWTDLGLNIGIGLAGSASPVHAAFTLEGGIAPGQLVVALGSMQIGGDPSSQSAGGFGSLEVDNGSAVTVDALSVLNHSAISVDAKSFVVVGPAASADPGAIAIEGGAGVVADIATFDAGVFNDGTLSVVAWQGDDQTEPGDLLISGTLFSGDVVTVAALATLTVAGLVEINSGSVSVGRGGTLQADNASQDSFGVYLAGGALTLDGGTLNSSGTADAANSNATLLDGALWTTHTFEIAPGFGNTTSADATIALSGGSTLSDSSNLFIGNDSTPGTSVAGGVGTLLLSGASTVKATTIELLNGSLLSLDATSTVMIGSASAEAGAIAVAADRLLLADIATIDANLDDTGTFDVAAFKGIAGGGPGDVRVSGSLTGTGDVFVTGTLGLGSASGFAGTIAIVGGGELILNAGDMANALVAASSGTVSIDVVGQAFDSTGFSPTYDASSGLLVFGDAASQSTLDVGPGRSLDDFSLAADGSGTLITAEAPCYVAGTLIRTDRGEVPVEALRVGDRVASALGGTAAVIWLGHRRVDCRRHPKHHDIWPVRVAAGAFGANQPHRDLWLSPDHAVFFAGALIPIRYLVNDATITQEPADEVTYWHVELPTHGVLLAEGLAAESYLDTGNRGAFANGGAAAMLHPDFALRVWEAKGCAKLVREGAELVAIRNVLFECAEALGHMRTRDAGLHVVANGRVVRPETTGRVHRFRLERMACAVRLVSRSAVPAAVRVDSDDHRRLGVAVARIVLDGRVIPLADARLGAGWHVFEADGAGGGWRWTDGNAGLDVAGAGVLEVAVAMTERYWLTAGRANARTA